MYSSKLAFIELFLEGLELTVYGRVSRLNKRSNVWIVMLRSGDTQIDQCVIIPKELLAKIELYSTLQVSGKIQKSPDGEKKELLVDKVLFYGEFSGKDIKLTHEATLQTARTEISQRLLFKRYQSIMFIRDYMAKTLINVSSELGLLRVFAPFITFSDCEGGGETFEVTSKIKDFFKQKAYLTVSGQVEEETATSRLLTPTYIFGPSFRSDPSQTRFHACEFWHYEPEIPFITLDGLMQLEQTIIQQIIKRTITHCRDAIEFLHQDYLKKNHKVEVNLDELIKYSNDEFIKCTYTDAIKILMKQHKIKPFEIQPFWGYDFSKEHEIYIATEHFKKPTFISNWPSHIKSFYMYQNEQFIDKDINDTESLHTCQGVDLLLPSVGELCGGSIREHRYSVLKDIIKSKQLDISMYKEYLSLRKEGTFPHGGFGLGFDRLIMLVTGAPHIRDVTIYPRYFGC